MYVTSTDFRQNIGKYLDLCSREDIYIMKHGGVFAKLSGAVRSREDSLGKISGMLDVEKGGFGEEGEERF